MTVETWVQARDPASTAEIPDAGSGEGQRIYRIATAQVGGRSSVDVGGQHRRRVLIWSAIAVPLAAVLVVLGLVVAAGTAHAPSAAAAVLKQAAASSQAQAPLTPGQYEYTETETRYRVTFYLPQGGGAPLIAGPTGYLDETNQVWTNATGNGHHLVTVGTAHFASASAQAMWNATKTSFEGEGRLIGDGAGQVQVQQPILSATGLSTNPSELASFIAQQKLQVSGRVTRTGGGISTEATSGAAYRLADGRSYTVFEGAAVLLVGPTAGMTPSLASALFQVMAEQPGVRSLGTVTDHNGQGGQGVAGGASSTEVDQVVVDPTTGQVLEARFAPPPATLSQQHSCPERPCSTQAQTQPVAVTTPAWTDVVARGVVSSSTTTVPATGTLHPVATKVPGAPTRVTVTDLPGGYGVHLSWTPPVDTRTGPVTGYVIHGVDTNGAFSVPGTGGRTTATQFTDPYSTPVGTYFVQAQNADGTGPASTPAKVSVVTPSQPDPGQLSLR